LKFAKIKLRSEPIENFRSHSAIAQRYLPAGRQGAANAQSMNLDERYFVYAIKSQRDKRIYVGMSEDVEKRVNAHNRGETKSIKPFRPWKLIYKKFIGTRAQARKEEKRLKSGYGKEFLKSLDLDDKTK